VGQVMFDPTGRYVAAAAGVFVNVWNAATGAPVKGGWSGVAPARELAFSENRSRLMILEDRLVVTDVEGGEHDILNRPMRGRAMAALSPTGNYAVKAAELSGVDFFDFLHTGNQARLIETTGTVTAVTLGSTEFGEVLAVGSDDGNLTILELAFGKHPKQIRPRNHKVAIGEIQSLAIRRNGLLVLTAGNAAFVWNARSMHPVSQPLDRLSDPRLLQFQSDGNSIVMASGSGIWRYRAVPPIRVTASLPPNAEAHADLAEAVGGYTLDEAGKPRVIPDDKRRAMFQALRQRSASLNDATLRTAIETFARAFLQ